MSSHIQFGSGGSDWPGPGAHLYPSLLSSAMKLSHLRAGRFFFFFRLSLRARRDEGAGERRPWDVRRVRMIGERLKVNSGRKPHRAASLAERHSASW